MFSIKEERCYRAFRNSSDVGFLGAGFVMKGPGVDARDAMYSHYALVMVFQGRGRFVDENGKSYPLFPGCVFQRLPNYTHSLYIDEGPEWIEGFVGVQHTPVINEKVVESLFEGHRDRAKFIDELMGVGCNTVDLLARLNVVLPDLRVWHYPEPEKMVKRFEGLINLLHSSDDADVAALQPKFINLIGEISNVENAEVKESQPDWLTEAIRRLKKDPAERTALPEILTGLGKSYPHLRAEFKRRMGISPGNFRIKCRIEEACVLLSRDGLNVQQVAFKLNYPDQFTFSAQFKQVMGISPGKFR